MFRRKNLRSAALLQIRNLFLNAALLVPAPGVSAAKATARAAYDRARANGASSLLTDPETAEGCDLKQIP
jgi:hypothetical protein